jgi:PAS domain S-box-containing protein
MKNTVKSQPKRAQGQEKSNIQPQKKKALVKRKLPVQTMPAQEEIYRRLFETSQDGILLLDAATGVISDANPVIEEMLGYSPADLIGKTLWETDPFKDVSASQAAFLRSQKKSYFRYEDLLLETKDGQHRNVDFVSNVYQVGSQKIIQCNLRDITDRRQAETALAESMHRYQELFDNAGLGIFQTTVDGRIMAVNPEFARMFGYQSPEEFIALVGNAADVFADPQRRAEIVRLKAANPNVMRFENLYRRKDGSTFSGSLTVRQATGQDGQALFEGLVEDISERKLTEEKLKENEELFRSFIEQSSEGVILLDEQGLIIEWNHAQADITGIERRRAIGSSFYDIQYQLLPPERRSKTNPEVFKKAMQNAFRTGEFPTAFKVVDAIISTPEGATKSILQASFPIKTERGYRIGSLVRDISERNRAKEELANVKTTLEAAFEQTPVPMVMVSMPDGVLRIVNSVCRDFLGVMDEPTPVGQRLADFKPSYRDYDAQGNLTPLAEAPLARALAGQRTLNQERRIVTKDGSTRWAMVSANPIYNANGALIAAYLIMPDITERKQAEEALQESENLIRESQVSAGLGSYVLDISAGLWKSSDMLDQLFGIDATYERSVDGWAALTHPDDRTMMIDYFTNEVIGQGKPFDKEYRIIRHDNQAERWVHGLGRLEFDALGQPLKMHGTIQDITERRQAQEALAIERNLLRSLIDNAPDSIYVKDTQGRIVLANMACAHRARLSTPEQMLGKTDYDFFPQELAERFTADDEVVFRTGQPLFHHEEPSIDADGNPKWISTNKVPLRDSQGKIYGLVGMGRDITASKQAQEALARERNLLRSLIDNVPDFIYVKDTQGRNVLANLASANRTNLSAPEDMLGTTDYDYFPKELADRYTADDQQVLQSGKPLLEHEEPTLDADGNQKWISTSKVPLRDSQGKIYGLVGMGRDITGRKQAEEKLASQAEELRRRNDELARLYRAYGSLISGASLNLQEMARSIVAVVQQEFGQANCSLLVVSRDSKELHRLAAAGPYTGQVKNKRLTLDGPGLVPQAVRTGATINAGDVRSRPDYLSNWEAAQSELAIPLKIGNSVIGVIDVQSSKPQAFTPDDERLMSIFAERAALVLEHGRLNAQTETHIQQLLALRTIDMAISSSFDLSMTLGVLLDQITRLLGVHAAEILAFNAPTQTFKFSCERGFRNHNLQHMQIKFGAGYAWSLVTERQMIIIPNIQAEADGLQRSPDLSGEQFVTYIGIPLLAKGQVKGVMEIFQRAPLVLEPEGYAFLEMLAGQAAIAIDNSELFEHLQSSNAELGMAYDSTLEGWANALALRDKETEGHTRRVAELSTRLAQTMGIRENDILQIYRGALLHDIGKMGVPDSIVLKPGPLTEDEWVIMRKHPQYAYDMLSPIAYLRQALDIPYCHHEKWDGTGYPRGLKGPQIPMAARIFAVVDVWDAITSDRPYRKAWPKEEVVRHIQEQSGRHFDPQVVKAFLAPSFDRE